jgi:hypothetical protein
MEFGSWKSWWSSTGKSTEHSLKKTGYEQICESEEILASYHTKLPSKKSYVSTTGFFNL